MKIEIFIMNDFMLIEFQIELLHDILRIEIFSGLKMVKVEN
jgi:hypothetical protein